MGYHVTVRRRTDPAAAPIPREAVRAWVASRGDLEVVRESEHALEFAAPTPDDAPLFVWQNGEVWVDGPDEATIALMVELARAMDAEVIGDEGERYPASPDAGASTQGAAGEPQAARGAAEREAEREATRAVRRRRDARQWILNASIILVFVLLALLVRACAPA